MPRSSRLPPFSSLVLAAALVGCGGRASSKPSTSGTAGAGGGPGGVTGAAGAAGSSTAGQPATPPDAAADHAVPPPDAAGAAGAPAPPPTDGGAANGAALPRLVAYVNCRCGFGGGTQGTTCLGTPDPTVNQVKLWEDAGQSPITHYVVSFLSFKGTDIQSDPGDIWQSGGGSATDFALDPGLRAALQSARAHGKKVMLSLGGEVGSSDFLAWWTAQGAGTAARVAGMRAKLAATVAAFTQQNTLGVDGIDIDIELGGGYAYDSDKYQATRDLINAVPDGLLAAFVPQVGNGLCAAPVANDPLPPTTVLGGQCMSPVNGDDTPWTLARLDQDCLKPGGGPRLDYFGIQYYNAGEAACCGGGADAASMITSTVQSYVNLANGWPAAGDLSNPANPWHPYQYFPGPWAAFAGIGADRLVLGKPGCQGCAGSDYLSPSDMKDLLAKLDGKLAKPMGGVLFWDLCRLFGDRGTLCVAGACQPSWGGGGDPRAGLAGVRGEMEGIGVR